MKLLQKVICQYRGQSASSSSSFIPWNLHTKRARLQPQKVNNSNSRCMLGYEFVSPFVRSSSSFHALFLVGMLHKTKTSANYSADGGGGASSYLNTQTDKSMYSLGKEGKWDYYRILLRLYGCLQWNEMNKAQIHWLTYPSLDHEVEDVAAMSTPPTPSCSYSALLPHLLSAVSC